MNLDRLQKSLLVAARRDCPSDRVPYAFEQRVMTAVRGLRPADPLVLWTAGLWRAALSSVAVAVVLVGANAVTTDGGQEGISADPLETALVASADPIPESW